MRVADIVADGMKMVESSYMQSRGRPNYCEAWTEAGEPSRPSRFAPARARTGATSPRHDPAGRAMQVQVGVDAGAVVDLAAELKEATERWGASFLTAPLAHPRHRRDARGSCVDAWTRSDLVLNSTQWGQQVVGKLSAWVVPRLDSCHVEIRRKAEAAFQQELAWAAHLTLAAVLAPPPPPGGVNYARCVSGVLHATQHMQIWVTVPLSAPPLSDAAPTGEGAAGAGPDEAAAGADGGGGGEGGGESAWRSWHRLRSLAEHHPNLGVALELGLDLPDEAAQLDRWCVSPMHTRAPRATDAHTSATRIGSGAASRSRA